MKDTAQILLILSLLVTLFLILKPATLKASTGSYTPICIVSDHSRPLGSDEGWVCLI